jgi:transposase
MTTDKKDGRTISREVMEHLRVQGIELWKKGRKVEQIAEDFGVWQSAVYKWINTYKKKGYDGLKRKIAPGAEPVLDVNERMKLVKLLAKTADNYGFETPLWDCKRVQNLIKEKFGKKLHVSNVWRLLKQLGLSSQKPERRASQQDVSAVERWIKEEWPRIKAHARRWQAMLYFQDESAVQLTAFLGRTWAPKGKTPRIRVSGARGRVLVTSAISIAGRMLFRLEKENVKSKQHVEFLMQVLKHHPRRKVVIVEDQAKPHTAKLVERFVQQNRRRLAVYYLPTYSPELNPDEHVWAYLKSKELKAHQAKTTQDFRVLVLSKMRSMQRKRGRVKSFFYGRLFY